jgi:hypothetical protein
MDGFLCHRWEFGATVPLSKMRQMVFREMVVSQQFRSEMCSLRLAQMGRPECRIESVSEMAFHEKAGRSQVDSSLVSLNKVFLPAEWPLSPCFHPHSRGANRFARCMLGVLVTAGAAI